MKTKTYRLGSNNWKAYLKPAGNGHEVGLIYKGKPLFIGNFVNRTEANSFWTLMNKEITKFGKKYTITRSFPITWYRNALAHHLHKCYYNYADKFCRKYQRKFDSAFRKDVNKYKVLKKRAPKAPVVPFRKAA